MTSFKPTSVRELLTEMKDVSDLMIDLAYATVLFESASLAERMHELETRMDDLMYRIRAVAAVVTRNIQEAKKITGILQVASAAETVSNATGDLADLVKRKMKIHPVICEALQLADEQVVQVEISKKSTMAGKTFHDLRLPSTIGVWTLALKRGDKWIIPPLSDTQIAAGDVLVSKGPKDGVEVFAKMAGKSIARCTPGKKFSKIRNSLAEMRDLTGIMVDMAYSAILFRSTEIAEDVRRFEESFDKLNYTIWLETLKAAQGEKDLERLNSVLQIARSMERISDAADQIADVVLRKTEMHPVFASALAESKEQIAKVVVSAGSELADKTISELRLWDSMGAYILVIKRGESYIVDPSRSAKIKAGDELIVRGSFFGIDKVKKTAGERK
ncbi:MAG: TrkA C-terminal domain-containing protein [Candidatus Hadarchaeota archaeon]